MRIARWYRCGTDCTIRCVPRSRSTRTAGTAGTDVDASSRSVRRLGAGRSQVQILSPRLIESPVLTGLSGLSHWSRSAGRMAVVPLGVDRVSAWYARGRHLAVHRTCCPDGGTRRVLRRCSRWTRHRPAWRRHRVWTASWRPGAVHIRPSHIPCHGDDKGTLRAFRRFPRVRTSSANRGTIEQRRECAYGVRVTGKVFGPAALGPGDAGLGGPAVGGPFGKPVAESLGRGGGRDGRGCAHLPRAANRSLRGVRRVRSPERNEAPERPAVSETWT